jgi:hypothetical protein
MPPRLEGLAAERANAEVITNVLNGEAKSKYIASNDEILRDQAKAFYTGIINAIDPTITVEFEFGQQ